MLIQPVGQSREATRIPKLSHSVLLCLFSSSEVQHSVLVIIKTVQYSSGPDTIVKTLRIRETLEFNVEIGSIGTEGQMDS